MAGVTDSTETTTEPATHARLPRFPALDGLKGLAVLAVVAYDLGTHWARGGHLGVSTLFTLFGFLAMAGILAARGDGTGPGPGLGSFWRGRIERILGPSLVALAIAVAFGFAAAAAVQRQHLAVDGIAALLSVANWRFILDHQPFGPATNLASPARQFWALAVIGQVLLVVSILAALLLDRAHWARERLGAIFAVLIVLSTALCVVLHESPSRVLYGTDTRAAEVLVGCLLAVVIYDPRVTIRLAMPGPVRDTINVVGVLSGLALLALWARVGPYTPFVQDGGLLIVALISAAVVLAAIVPDGPVSWLLGTTPIRLVGRIAIVLFLVHWPLYVWIDENHTGLHGVTLVAARLAAAFAAAIVVQFVLERIRGRDTDPADGRLSRGRVAVGAVAVIAVVAGLVAVTVTRPQAEASTRVEAGGPTTTAFTGPPPTVAFYGDAMASTLEAAAKSWGDRTGRIKVVPGVASPTCGIDRDQLVRAADGTEVPIPAECSTWDARWAAAVAADKPDVAVVVTGISELGDHRQPTDATDTGPGNQGYDYQLLLLMHKAVDLLSASGTKVIWLNLPPFTTESGPTSSADRIAAFNKLLTSVGKDLAKKVTVVDLATWTAANGGPGAEPSDQGWGASAANHVAVDFLAPQIEALWRAAHSKGPAPTTTSSAPVVVTTPTTLPPPPGVGAIGKTPATTRTKRAASSTTASRRP